VRKEFNTTPHHILGTNKTLPVMLSVVYFRFFFLGGNSAKKN